MGAQLTERGRSTHAGPNNAMPEDSKPLDAEVEEFCRVLARIIRRILRDKPEALRKET
jgi:hypothetical protein